MEQTDSGRREQSCELRWEKIREPALYYLSLGRGGCLPCKQF